MIPRGAAFRLLLIGAGPRLAGAALIALLHWAMFLWATQTPGGA